MESRCRQLNAFEKSSLAMTDPGCREPRKRWVAWTTASQPPLTAAPIWRGAKQGASLHTAKELAHLKASLRKVNPTAMGRMPPDFLFNATRRWPNRTEVISKWHFPCKRRLVSAVRDVKRSAPDSWQLTKSSRCWGWKPSGPPEDPTGKERMVCKTLVSSTDNED